MTQPRPPAMKMTTLLLSEEDHAVIDALRDVVSALTGSATLAAVVRFAIRQAAALQQTKQIAVPAKPRTTKKRKAGKSAANASTNRRAA